MMAKAALLGTTVRAPTDFSLPEATTSSAADYRAATVQEMLAAIEEITCLPTYIGELMGMDVYADPRVPGGEVVVRDPKTREERLRFRVEHPYLNGTKIQKAAREALCTKS